MQKTEIKILFLVTVFSFLICLPVITTHAFLVNELPLFDKSQKQIIHESEITGFDDNLSSASNNINESTGSISSSVVSIEEASSQLNSLLFPIIASIGLIVALQITIIARRR